MSGGVDCDCRRREAAEQEDVLVVGNDATTFDKRPSVKLHEVSVAVYAEERADARAPLVLRVGVAACAFWAAFLFVFEH